MNDTHVGHGLLGLQPGHWRAVRSHVFQLTRLQSAACLHSHADLGTSPNSGDKMTTIDVPRSHRTAVAAVQRPERRAIPDRLAVILRPVGHSLSGPSMGSFKGSSFKGKVFRGYRP